MRLQIDKMRFIALFATAFFTGYATASFAGAWTQPAGKLYDKLSINNYSATRYLDSEGKKQDLIYDGKFTDVNVANYFEYGLTDNISLINSLFAKKIESAHNFAKTTTSGIGDIEFGVKHKLAEGGYGVLSHQATIKVPGLYDKKSSLPLGNGQFDAEYRLLYGVSLWRLIPGYANIEAGYRYRAEAPSDEFRYLAEIGGDITDKFYIRAKLDGILSMKNDDKVSDVSGNPTTIYQFDLGKLDAAAGYKLGENWGIEFGYTPTLYGKNTADGTTYSLGVTYQIR